MALHSLSVVKCGFSEKESGSKSGSGGRSASYINRHGTMNTTTDLAGECYLTLVTIICWSSSGASIERRHTVLKLFTSICPL